MVPVLYQKLPVTTQFFGLLVLDISNVGSLNSSSSLFIYVFFF